MDNTSQKETVIALGQLLQPQLSVCLCRLQVIKTLPFSMINNNTHRLEKSKFAKTNRIIDLTWSDPHVTHISKQIHAHKHQTTNNYLTKHNNLYSNASKTKNITLDRISDKASSNNNSADKKTVDEPLIGHSCAYRPFFNVGKYSSKPGNKIKPGYRYNPQLVGLLSNRGSSRQAIAKNTKTNLSTTTNPQFNKKMQSTSLSWSISYSTVENLSLAAVQSVQNIIDKTNNNYLQQRADSEAFTSGRNVFSTNFIENLPFHDHTKAADLKAFAVQSVNTVTKNKNFNIPFATSDYMLRTKISATPLHLPQKKVRLYPSNGRSDSQTLDSSPLTEKIETMIENKVTDAMAQTNRDKITLPVINEVLKSSLRPERLITDEMVRLLLKKINQAVREERFRMGLLY